MRCKGMVVGETNVTWEQLITWGQEGEGRKEVSWEEGGSGRRRHTTQPWGGEGIALQGQVGQGG